jgi:YVTN family beta-propeller protein
MKNNQTILKGLLVMCFAFWGKIVMAQQHVLLALSKGDHVLAIIDPSTLKIITRIPVGNDPHEVIASADGKVAYVSILGGGQSHEIDVIDLVAGKRLQDIDTRPLIGPHGLDFSGGKLYFSAEGTKTVGRFDPASGKLDWCIGTGQDRTHMVYVTSDQKRIYTTNVSSGSVSIFVDTLLSFGPGPLGPPPGGQPNGQSGGQQNGQQRQGPPSNFGPRHDWVMTLVPVSRGSEGFDVSPDGHELWTASGQDGVISLVDLGSKKLISHLDAKAPGANRLKFTPDGKMVLISSLGNGDLLVIDAATHQLVKKINIGHGGAGILMDPDGTRAFIGCTPDNYIAVIDLKKLELAMHIDLGGPDGLAWAVKP